MRFNDAGWRLIHAVESVRKLFDSLQQRRPAAAAAEPVSIIPNFTGNGWVM